MIRFFLIGFLVISPFHLVSAKQDCSPIEVVEDEEETLLGQNTLECIRTLAVLYDELTPEGKEELLIDLDLTETIFNQLREISALNWKTEGRYRLPKSNSTLSIPCNYALLTGAEARSINTIVGEPYDEHTEAYVCDLNDVFETAIIFQNLKTGYVSIDDWKEIDAKNLLKSITQNTEEGNKERRKMGVRELHVIGWIQEPTLDYHTKTVYWAIEADAGDEENLVNSVAIRLGREGYEKVTWVTSRSSYVPFGGHLDTLLRAHSFDPGYRYKDYQEGDKLAGYGIATLVAATVGGKVVKAGGLIAILKKVGGFLVAGAAAFFYKLKNLFRRNEE